MWNCWLGLCHSRRYFAEKEYSRPSYPRNCQHLVFAEQLVKEGHTRAQVSQSGCVTGEQRSWTLYFLRPRLLRFSMTNKNQEVRLPITLGFLVGLQGFKEPARHSLAQIPGLCTALPGASPSSAVPGWSDGYYGPRRYLKVPQTSASDPWKRD